MSVKVDFDHSFPKELRESVRALMRAWVPHVLSAVRHIRVFFADLDDAGAITYVQTRYRYQRVELGAWWASASAKDREEALVHELAHALVAPLARRAMTYANLAAEDDEGLLAHMYEEIEEAEEGVVQDIALMALSLHRSSKD